LIADEHQEVRETLAEYLRVVGWQVKGVASAEELTAVAITFRPAAIVLDLGTPRAGGAKTIRALKGDPRTARLPIVVLTSYEETSAEAMAAGADAFLVKPCDPRSLVLELATALSAKGSAGRKH
jgi:CheY-like chemotaxis protein